MQAPYIPLSLSKYCPPVLLHSINKKQPNLSNVKSFSFYVFADYERTEMNCQLQTNSFLITVVPCNSYLYQ